MEITEKRFKIIENGATHTERLKLAEAEEMLERYQRTYPNVEFWIEKDWPFTYFKR